MKAGEIPRFNRDLFGSEEKFTRIGSGEIGGKAHGLAFIKQSLADGLAPDRFAGIEVNIPTLTVIGTDTFDAFMEQNKLHDVACSGQSDERIAHAFQQAEFPAGDIGDLRGLIEKIHSPLAIRSSSLLEDAMFQPFAGVYGTKMIPNNQPSADERFRRLIEAIKFVYASTYFKDARDYVRATGKPGCEEKMAVILQEVVGRRHDDRYYPDISGVARSHNFYPYGHAVPEEGVIVLALGLGKSIVDGGKAWNYCPRYPLVGPPYGSPSEILKQTQSEFWAVNMGRPPAYDPVREAEYLIQGTLSDAEMDCTLKHVASTYQPQNDRIVLGVGVDGPRVLNFAPTLRLNELPLNDLVCEVMAICEKETGKDVEIEFAVTIDPGSNPSVRFGFLQVRPMVVSHEEVDVAEVDMDSPSVLIASERVMGNGAIDTIEDIVYVKPETFLPEHTRRVAAELDMINRTLSEQGRRYLLIGFGRWGSSDPWLGIPVNWGQISAAKVIVEATLPEMNVELSQGAHFFHNITSFQVCHLSVPHTSSHPIDWDWLARQAPVIDTAYVRHVRVKAPLKVRVDGKSGRGVINHE